MIRQKDRTIQGPTLTYMNIDSVGAISRLMDLAFRDAITVLDITYGKGNFWSFLKSCRPPQIELTTNNIDPKSKTDLHLDFTDTGLDDNAFDLVIYDPPHLADAGTTGIMRKRYGTVEGTEALKLLVRWGAEECWRIAEKGIIVKVIDSAHGGEYVRLSDEVISAIPMRPYCVMHTFRPTNIDDPKRVAERVPRNNGAIYLVFRKNSHKHIDFERLYSKWFTSLL